MTKDEYEDFVLRYKGCGACFPLYLNLNYFEKKWFSAIQKDVAELTKENAKLKARVGLSIECDKAQKNGNLCLGYGGDEDEPCERCKNCIKCECGYYQLGETEKDEQLTKAKLLLKQLVDAFPKSYSDVVKDTLEEAEQFLKEE